MGEIRNEVLTEEQKQVRTPRGRPTNQKPAARLATSHSSVPEVLTAPVREVVGPGRLVRTVKNSSHTDV